jgi:hypothetical protein
MEHTSTDNLQRARAILDECEEDYRRAKGGNKAAGTRVRKAMQDLKKVAQDTREEMLNIRSDT